MLYYPYIMSNSGLYTLRYLFGVLYDTKNVLISVIDTCENYFKDYCAESLSFGK